MLRNKKILTEIIPKYLHEVQDNNELLKNELNAWESISAKGDNPHNMKQHLNKLTSELDEWRNLIPGKHTIKLAKKYLNQSITKPTKSITITDENLNDMNFYNNEFISKYGPLYNLVAFDNVNDFIKEKNAAIQNIINAEIDTLTKVVNDKYYFIKYFEYKKQEGIEDKDFNVNEIDNYTKW